MFEYDEDLNINYDERLNQKYHKKLIFDNSDTKVVLIVAPKVSKEDAEKIWDRCNEYRAEIFHNATGHRVKYTRV